MSFLCVVSAFYAHLSICGHYFAVNFLPPLPMTR